MTSENSDNGFSVSMPIGAAVTGVVLIGAGLAAYLLMGPTETSSSSTNSLATSGKSMVRRFGLMSLITLIENDATRKVLVTVLKAMARRG